MLLHAIHRNRDAESVLSKNNIRKYSIGILVTSRKPTETSNQCSALSMSERQRRDRRKTANPSCLTHQPPCANRGKSSLKDHDFTNCILIKETPIYNHILTYKKVNDYSTSDVRVATHDSLPITHCMLLTNVFMEQEIPQFLLLPSRTFHPDSHLRPWKDSHDFLDHDLFPRGFCISDMGLLRGAFVPIHSWEPAFSQALLSPRDYQANIG